MGPSDIVGQQVTHAARRATCHRYCPDGGLSRNEGDCHELRVIGREAANAKLSRRNPDKRILIAVQQHLPELPVCCQWAIPLVIDSRTIGVEGLPRSGATVLSELHDAADLRQWHCWPKAIGEH